MLIAQKLYVVGLKRNTDKNSVWTYERKQLWKLMTWKEEYAFFLTLQKLDLLLLNGQSVHWRKFDSSYQGFSVVPLSCCRGDQIISQHRKSFCNVK